jgi:hypothetical protein
LLDGETTLPTPAAGDRALIECLHELVFDDQALRALVESALEVVTGRFGAREFTAPYSSQGVPIAPFQARLDPALRERVQLCRVFALRRGQRLPHPEIHRNSVQRLVSFRGEGAVHSALPGGGDEAFVAHHIYSPAAGVAGDVLRSWDVVPEQTWHFPEARGEGDWCGVAFHSVPASEMLEEYSRRST